ncbi:TlpA disulfide reductase family protein [Mucilaginibacter paludis]|uniref:Alkyl hydroperoxide reductase/ Thiol specific antioxidant/ Mal allergen n=1 Tax=Mucilaginibacter paludis DSM 18603 TaxID=714943 RepID=H1YGG3_9SPHI|nr:TlpA disulfide reductase family protein [Mucilaginibacter paludis]EHQ24515.1 alkyl hydroperoxide reductase/ Thiol specific antioxidant/ Mal allergen [Mucilaginibacter paludis DSM 18603]
MKTNIILLAILASASVALSSFQYQPPGFKITGKITGLTDGKVYLEHTLNKQTFTDSTLAKNGTFVFEGTTAEPLLYTVKIGNRQQKVFFVENANITLTGSKDSLYKASVRGSKTQDEYMDFYDVAWKPITAKAGDIYRRLAIANQNGKIKLDSASHKPFDDEFAALDQLNQTIVSQYVASHTHSVAAAVVIQDRFINFPNYDVAAKLFTLLTDNVKNSYYGKEVKARLDLASKTAVGKMAPQFVMNDTTGKAVKLSDYKGQYVLIDFWASWCGPCRAENPNVVKVYQKYHAKGLEIIGVSLDGKKEAWLKAIHADKLTWQHVSDLKGWQNAVALQYGISAVPQNFLLDKEGKIIATNLRGKDLEVKMAQVLAAN